jgi:hypothetical protein
MDYTRIRREKAMSLIQTQLSLLLHVLPPKLMTLKN